MKRRRILQVLFFITLMILLWATFSLNWIGDNFGGVGFDKIMFHLNMPLKGTGQSLVGSYVHKVLVPAVGILRGGSESPDRWLRLHRTGGSAAP